MTPETSTATGFGLRTWLLWGGSALGAGLMLIVVVIGVALLISAGCGGPELEVDYGRQRTTLSTASINGTDALAGMFKAAGHTVETRRVLISSAMDSVETIVWFPDDTGAPDGRVCSWFDAWLSLEPGRTLIYVGRDFDAEYSYWKKVAPQAPQEQRTQYEERVVRASARASMRKSGGDLRECQWFKIEPAKPPYKRKPSGMWAEGLDLDKCELELVTWLAPELKSQPLLMAGDDPFVSRIRRDEWEGNQLILVANGSFLLNVPLVNHEHRKLAAELIKSAGPGRVVFLESERGGPPIDPQESDNSFWKVFGAWPLNAILLHLAVLGLIFCFARWPIFGRPRVTEDATTADFGKHVTALGALLKRTKDRDFALGKVAEAEGPLAGSRKT